MNPPDTDHALPCPAGCGGLAEPEQDGEHRYHECPGCGYAFGWVRVRATPVAVNAEGSCALGVPEPLRRAASTPMQHTLATVDPPLIQIRRRPDAPAP